ncbi:60S ribosomal protein L27 [Lemmus lemmus]
MGRKKSTEPSKIKFIRTITHAHRSSAGISLDKTVVNKDVFRDPALRHKARLEAQVKFEE